MSIFIEPTVGTKIQYKNLWLRQGSRQICITYTYTPYDGSLRYAATVYKMGEDKKELEYNELKDHEETTRKRFKMRPVVMRVDSMMSHEHLVYEIRHQMCHGKGCKGPRKHDNSDDAASDTSSNSAISVDPDEFQVSQKIHEIKTVRCTRYYLSQDDEPRHIFIAFKGSAKTGELLYGATIMRPGDPDYNPSEEEVELHYKTALKRLNKCPVHMKASSEAKHQLGRSAKHREDLTVEIVDEIFSRRSGYLQIRGTRV